MVQVGGRELSPVVSHGLCTRPCLGEAKNGDRGVVVRHGGVLLAMVVDGLGHGPKAALAATIAAELLETTVERDPKAIMEALNSALRGTVGAVASVISLDCRTGGIAHCGVGNVATRVTGGAEARLVGIDGVLGSLRRNLRVEHSRLVPGGMVIMTSDGVSLGFDPGALAGLTVEDGARFLVDTHGHKHDDATALVLRIEP